MLENHYKIKMAKIVIMELEIYCDQCCEENVKYNTLSGPVVLSGCESLTHKN